MEYEKLLDRLYMSLPKQALNRERFEMPVAESFIQGSKTMVKNFSQILKTIRREESDVLKFLTKEAGTGASVQEGRLILNRKFTAMQVNELFGNYIRNYVLCKECNKPDTHFIEQQGVRMLKCEACGAMAPVKRG